MRKLGMVLLAAVIILPVAALDGQEGYYSGSFIRLNYVQGEVVIQRAGDLGYEQGEVNLALTQGDKLAAKNGRAEIHFGKSNYLRINDMSQVEFANLPRGSGDPTKLNVLSGDVYLRIGLLEQEKDFEIHTPDASFYILEEGLYRFTVRENAETELRVIRGSAEAAGEEGSILVQADEQLVASNGNLGSHSSLPGGWDEFDRWNGSRDDLLKPSASTRYLPSEISEYEDELDDNGQWVYERPYGYVWVPTGIYSDWRPYYYGRWVWYPIIGWTWVSQEPWGWSTYHYGRWHWRLGLGWHWIPTIHWGPAWVHWYHGYDYYAWCPLSYYNRPVVVVNNYFYDRYYGTDYPLNSRALTVVHRNQLQDRQVHRVALSQNQITSLGRISLKAATPDVRPAIRQSVGGMATPAKVFSGGQIRKVEKSYGGSGAAVSSPGLKSPGSGGLSRATGTGTVTSGGGVLKKDNLSSAGRSTVGGASGGATSTARPSIRKITSYPSTNTATRKPSSSISGNSGGATPRNVRSNSGSSFRDDPSPSRSRIKSYAPSEKSTSTSRSSITPSTSRTKVSSSSARPGVTSSSGRPSGTPSTSRGKTANYPSSSRIVKKSDTGGATSSSGRTNSSVSSAGRSTSYIRSDSNYIRSRTTSGYAPSTSVSRQARPSISRSVTSRSNPLPSRITSAPRAGIPSSRSYSAPRPSSSSSRSFSPSRSGSSSSRSFSAPRQSYSAPRMSSPSVRSGSSSSGSVSRSAPRSSSGSSSRSSGRIVKKS